MLTPSSSSIDGEALIRAMRRGPHHYEKLVNQLRAGGATDPEMVKAMVGARGMISPLRLRGRQ
jgi:hypothetical protein